MMAKMFYTLDEAKSALGKSEDEIKQYSKEGRLREFRDGTRLMYKADQVEQLKNELTGGGSSDQVDLGTSDSGGLIGLVDTTGASGTSITLSDDIGQSSTAGLRPKEDTALAADLGLSGTMGGVPSPGRVAASGTGLSGTATGRIGGINVFGGEEPESVDPSAQTAISGAVREQMNLEGVGSGSGLLDLTRESDDTSLGAVLDEISPGNRSGVASGIPSDQMSDEPVRVSRAAPPEMVVAADPMAPAFAGLALGGSLVIIFGAYVLICDMVGTRPDVVSWFNEPKNSIPGWVIAALGSLVLCGLLFIIGMIVGKSSKA
ncbi:MAG TPA: hypothetical protein VHY37_10375 [Tepidisphaeraceae bacterium]|jgi:hypothetical protein|nr:hypothetical protein [Tepidisphaeraceae bacterium]